MILYQPAKDLSHCVYRFISLLLNLDEKIAFEKLRLIDFYYLFPHLMKDITPWPSDIRIYKNSVKNIPEAYEKMPNKRRVFFEMADVHKVAISVLNAKGMIDHVMFKSGFVVIDLENIPTSILDEINNDDFIKSDSFKAIVNGLVVTKWNGKNGLKDRAGLLEYKYDE